MVDMMELRSKLISDCLKLSNTYGISGWEKRVATEAMELLRPYMDTVEVDRYGNLIGKKIAKDPSAPTLMMDAHFDQVGLMVRHITDDGYLLVEKSGGVDPRVLPGGRVLVITPQGESYCGILGGKPSVFDDEAAAAGMDQLYVDLGMDGDQAKSSVPVGSPVYFYAPARVLSEDTLEGCALDDRACFATILYGLEKLKQEGRDIDYNLIVVGTTLEEVRGKGAFGLACELQPDLAVAVDVCHAATYDSNSLEGVWPMGCGPAIAVGACGDAYFAEKLMEACEEQGIPYEVDANVGESWTNCDGFFEAGMGVPTMLVSLPLRYMHTPVEMMSLTDGENVGKALAELMGSFGQWAKGGVR